MRRRELLQACAAAGLLAVLPRGGRAEVPRFTRDPYRLGVASGEPEPDGFVIWTRLALQPLLDDGGLPPEPIPVAWEVAQDEGFRQVVQRGSTLALPEWAHAVHVEVRGLQPDREYWYRFAAGGARSRAGRSRTLPALNAKVDRFRLAWASCQNYELGYFSAYRHLVADAPDLVLHVGDYLYEGNEPKPLRRDPTPAPRTLADYRRRHAQYKTDPDLQAAHRLLPWCQVWDDHDVQNDYANLESAYGEPPEHFAARRMAAYRAYYEHMPLRARARPQGLSMQLYTRVRIGRLMQLHLLDGRQYRDDQVCSTPGRGGQSVPDCPERHLPLRSLLGAPQERWLEQGLALPAQWQVLGQALPMATVDQRPGPEVWYWSDGWDGYPENRARILAAAAQQPVCNLVSLGGDIHSYWANELRPRPDAPAVGVEFIGSSISSPGVPYAPFMAKLPDNPHVRYFESRRRGYGLCEITPRLWTTQFRAVDDVADPASGVSTLARFAVEAGRAEILVD